MIHSPFGVCLARSPMRRANSSGLVASFNCTASRARPPLTKCTCESLKPGRSSLPSASITRVLGASPIIDIGIGADRDNAIAEDCDRLRGGIGFVYRPDFGVGDDEIGSGTGLGSGG